MPSLVPLADLAGRINAEHEAAHVAARSAIEHAIECGRLLSEAKGQLGHGRWLPWVDGNLAFGARQAQKYMRVAEHADAVLAANANSGSRLSINDALKLLAAPEGEAPEPETGEEFLAEARAFEAEASRLRAQAAKLSKRLDRAETAEEALEIRDRAAEIIKRADEIQGRATRRAQQLFGWFRARGWSLADVSALFSLPPEVREALFADRIRELKGRP